MKAIYDFGKSLCVVVEEYDDVVLLEPVDGDADQRFEVRLDDPGLILDPTDDEVREVRA